MQLPYFKLFFILMNVCCIIHADAQIGRRFPSERREITDPVTGAKLTFLTSKPHGDSKIYPTHPQWTADGNWIIFRSALASGEALAVNENTGVIVQVSEGGFTGMLNVAQRSMKLYFMRDAEKSSSQYAGKFFQIIEVDLESLFKDSESKKIKSANHYQRVCGTTPRELGAGGDMALDAGEEWVYFRLGKEHAQKHLQPGTKIEEPFGPRGMGAGPSGIARMNIKTGEFKHVISVPFQVGHIQANLWNPNEIIFSWETGGKSPQRTWTVMADGSALRPLYPEAPYEWVTHEAIISKDEVALAIMGHRKVLSTDEPINGPSTGIDVTNPGQEAAWGPSGTREKPTGLAIINLRTREMIIAGQTKSGSGLWHVHGSQDGRWAVGDDFDRSIYLIDRHTNEMMMLTTGHKSTAADHPHPSFSPDGTKIEIQSAMLSEDDRTMNICLVHLPQEWLERKSAID